MEYSTHRILKTGHIELREKMENGMFHRSVIAPNEPIPTEYQAEIEADPNFALYRTQENADAYEAQLLADQPSEEEQLESWRKTASLTRRKFMLGIKFYPHGEGTLESAINALREGLEEPMKTVIETSLDESTHFDRADQDLIAMATAIGMTPEQVDEFYVWAENEEWRN